MNNDLRFSEYLSHNSLDKLKSLTNKSNNINIQGLKGSSKYFFIYLLANLGRKILYLSENKKISEYNQSNLSAILGKQLPLLLSKTANRKRSLLEKANFEEINRISAFHKFKNSNVLCADSLFIFEVITPERVLNDFSIKIKTGEEVDRDNLIYELIRSGYELVEFVERYGEFSIRGSIVDIFSAGYNYPFRIEFFGNSINSIRDFNSSTQKSIRKREDIHIHSASFIIFDKENITKATEKITSVAEELGLTAREKYSILDKINQNKRTTDFEWFTNYFHPSEETILDHLGDKSVIVFDEQVDLESLYSQHRESFNKSHLNKLIPDFEQLYNKPNKVKEKLNQLCTINLDPFTTKSNSIQINYKTDYLGIEKNNITSLIEKINLLQTKKYKIFFFSYSESEKEKLDFIIKNNKINDTQTFIGLLENGIILNDLKLALITENDITDKKNLKPKNFSRFNDIPSVFITTFSNLKPGDYIVHKEFGIGIFKGLVNLNFNNKYSDFIECEYKDGDKVFVPVEKLKLVQKYIGDKKKPTIDKLGSKNWKHTVKKAKKAVENIAKDLLELYAKRKMEKGFKFSPRDQIFNEFELSFPFNETYDQTKAIEDVIKDMETDKPMDRLICGDVGFGKTEVALRTAFKASMDGKQVIFIAPTTLLANQHYKNSIQRLKNYPIEIDLLSRFRTRKEEKKIIKKIEDGTIDIIIGTHKLLNSNIKFRDLGLIIVDEEQKFGVKNKEYLRSLKSGVDVLTLSATPIPRTLQISMTDIRDMSLINTPPEGRIPVEVYVQTYNPKIVRDAVINEFNRGGSVFFIHNRIDKLFEIAEKLKELIPEAKITVTHGSMNERILENSINRFIKGEVNLLVTTAIVESGLDIPKANTIIVNDAHTFGLADLYQLKGRVGRSDIAAYSYFLIPSLNKLTPEARKRLEVISELKDLGSGFKLALSDLEIRGAGNLFGKEQSGHIANIGLEFYMDLLNNTINRLKENKGNQFDYEPEIKSVDNAFIPENYIESSSQRLFYYKKLASIQRNYEVKKIQTELEDKFGKLPNELKQLLKFANLKILLKEAFIKKIEIAQDHAVLSFLDISPYPKIFKLGNNLKIYFNSKNRYSTINNRIKKLIQRNFNLRKN